MSEKKSIVPEKYAKTVGTDWFAKTMDSMVKSTIMKTIKIKDEEGNVTGEKQEPTKRTSLDLEKFFTLCELNSVAGIPEMKKIVGERNAAGRIRMTLGNRLRALTRKRHGLWGLDKEWIEADKDWLGDAEKSLNQDGSKIEKAKETEAAE